MRTAGGLWLAAGMALALASGLLLGRRFPAEPEPPPSYLTQLADILDLRADQVAAIDALLTAEDRDLDAWLADSLAGLADRVAERRRRTEQELLACLDADQRARYVELSRGLPEATPERR